MRTTEQRKQANRTICSARTIASSKGPLWYAFTPLGCYLLSLSIYSIALIICLTILGCNVLPA